MFKSTNLTSENDPGGLARGPGGGLARNTGGILVNWLAICLRGLGGRLFVMNDAEAGWRDWQTISCRVGLGRRYRDARFDFLVWCPGCDGDGIDPAVVLPCAICAGTGRLVRERPASSPLR